MLANSQPYKKAAEDLMAEWKIRAAEYAAAKGIDPNAIMEVDADIEDTTNNVKVPEKKKEKKEKKDKKTAAPAAAAPAPPANNAKKSNTTAVQTSTPAVKYAAAPKPAPAKKTQPVPALPPAAASGSDSDDDSSDDSDSDTDG